MVVVSVLALSLALAMDATAVAAARGLAAQRLRARDVALIAFLFGGAQAVMPLGGWWLGDKLGPFVASFDHWIAFALLTLLGLKMIREALSDDDSDGIRSQDAFALRPLLVLAVATSIDAFAAGLTLPLLDVHPALACASIGVVTAATSALGALIGARVGAHFGARLEILGGAVLVLLGLKILVEHTLLG